MSSHIWTESNLDDIRQKFLSGDARVSLVDSLQGCRNIPMQSRREGIKNLAGKITRGRIRIS